MIVASVSCLYGMGMPADYVDAWLSLEPYPEPGESYLRCSAYFQTYSFHPGLLLSTKYCRRSQ